MTESSAAQRASEIRPFHVNVPEAELADLRRRTNATKWPERETVADATQGVQLGTTQALTRYSGTDYDWRKCEAKLNALPNFITEIDGLDLHQHEFKVNEERYHEPGRDYPTTQRPFAVQYRPHTSGPVDDHLQQPAD